MVDGFTLAYVLSAGALMIDKHSEFLIRYLDCLYFHGYNPGQQLVSFSKCSSLLGISITPNSSGAEPFFLIALFIPGLYLSVFPSLNFHKNPVTD